MSPPPDGDATTVRIPAEVVVSYRLDIEALTRPFGVKHMLVVESVQLVMGGAAVDLAEVERMLASGNASPA